MFWNLLVIDACLYCTREMLHHKIFVFEQENFFTMLSYVIALLGLFLSLLELGMVIRYIYRLLYKIDSYVLSDLLSVEGVNKLLCQYEVQLVNLEERLSTENYDITKIRKSIRKLLLKSMISQGSHQQLYLNDVANAIRMQEQVSLQSFIARKNASKSEVELTALDLYPKVRMSLQPRLERAIDYRDSIPLINRNRPRNPSILMDEP